MERCSCGGTIRVSPLIRNDIRTGGGIREPVVIIKTKDYESYDEALADKLMLGFSVGSPFSRKKTVKDYSGEWRILREALRTESKRVTHANQYSIYSFIEKLVLLQKDKIEKGVPGFAESDVKVYRTGSKGKVCVTIYVNGSNETLRFPGHYDREEKEGIEETVKIVQTIIRLMVGGQFERKGMSRDLVAISEKIKKMKGRKVTI